MAKYKVTVNISGYADGKLEVKLDSLNEVFTFIGEQVDFSYLDDVSTYMMCGMGSANNVFNLKGIDRNNPLHKGMEVRIEVWKID